jgi:chromosome segregation ATPase
LGGAAGLGWMQYQDLATKHSSLLQRFELLESRLSSTDESVIQSGAAMQVTISKQGDQLKKHWSEIKKLWGVTNDINKGKIEKNQKDISFLASKRNTLEESVNKDSKKLATLSANYLGMAADVEAIAESMRNQSDGLNRINSSVALINQRIKNNAEGIESMEAFRRQINQKIYALEQRSGATLTQTGSN